MQSLNIRLPKELHQQAKADAQRRGIALNALVILALEAYLRNDAPPPAPVAPIQPLPPLVDDDDVIDF